MIKKAHTDRNTAGFTLVELSVVLVIIGLIVGGIMVGVDLVNAAQIRGTVSQFEKYNSAVNTFRIKYDGIPGDLLVDYAQAFGLFSMTPGGGPGQGDGNGVIEGGASNSTAPSGETLLFWRQLSDAQYLDGVFGSTGNAAIVAATGVVTADNNKPNLSLPPTKIKPAQYFIAYSDSGLNYFQILPIATITAAGAYTFETNGITPIQAYNIDVKLDDGTPNGGGVTAAGIAAVDADASWAAVSTVNDCLMGGTNATDQSATYNRAVASGGKKPSCSVRFRFN